MQRFVYYLEASVRMLSDVDTSRSSRFRAKVESLLDAPRSAFAKSLSPHVRQIKHRGAKLRAFATRCRGERREVLVVHFVYRKRNEQRHFDRLDDYDEEGRQFKARFRELGDDEFEAWRESARASAEVMLVGPDYPDSSRGPNTIRTRLTSIVSPTVVVIIVASSRF